MHFLILHHIRVSVCLQILLLFCFCFFFCPFEANLWFSEKKWNVKCENFTTTWASVWFGLCGSFLSFSICLDVCWHQHRNSVKTKCDAMRTDKRSLRVQRQHKVRCFVFFLRFLHLLPSHCHSLFKSLHTPSLPPPPPPSPLLSVTGPAMCCINTKWQSL